MLLLKQRQHNGSLGQRRLELKPLQLAELPGEQQHAVCCAPGQPFHGDVGRELLEEGWEGGEHLGGQGGQCRRWCIPPHWCSGGGRLCPHRSRHGETRKQLLLLSAGWTSWLRLATLKQQLPRGSGSPPPLKKCYQAV